MNSIIDNQIGIKELFSKDFDDTHIRTLPNIKQSKGTKWRSLFDRGLLLLPRPSNNGIKRMYPECLL